MRWRGCLVVATTTGAHHRSDTMARESNMSAFWSLVG